MTKTPDEIKKGLVSCLSVGKCWTECLYFAGEALPFTCIRALSADALALIQQLEAELSDAKNNHQHTIDIAEKQKEQIGKLKSVIVKLNKARVPRWISVEERLPKTCAETRSFYHSVTVLASENGRIMIGCFTTSKDDGSFDFSGIDSQKHFYDFAKPSHWMPLPEPPKEESK